VTTRFVITQCCAAPVRLAWPNFQCDAAEVVCCACSRTAGTPGGEDAPEVDQFLDWFREMPILHARLLPAGSVEGARLEITSEGTRWFKGRIEGARLEITSEGTRWFKGRIV
jgi:hypothetical protein